MRKCGYNLLGRYLKIMVVSCMVFMLVGCGSKMPMKDVEESENTESVVIPFANANDRYQYANDSMIYRLTTTDEEETEYQMEQWGFDGVKGEVYDIPTGEEESVELLYVNNEELFYGINEGEKILSVPIRQNDTGQELVLDEKKIEMEYKDDTIAQLGDDYTRLSEMYSFYANESYLVFLGYDIDEEQKGNLYVYDRKKGKKIKIKNDLSQRHYFTDMAESVLSNICGEYVIFNTQPVGDRKYHAPYGFSVYHMGDDTITTIDERCYTAAAYIADEKRQKVYYQIENDQSIWEFDLQTGKKQEFIAEQEIHKCYEEQGLPWVSDEDDDSMYIVGDTLYLLRAKGSNHKELFSYDLQKKQGLRYERAVSEAFAKIDQELEPICEKLSLYYDPYCVDFVEDKIIYDGMYLVNYLIDINTAEAKVVATPGDLEQIYFWLLGREATEARDDTLDSMKEKAKQAEEREQEKLEKIQKAKKKVAEMSAHEQIEILSEKAYQQYQKGLNAASEAEYCEVNYYSITDLDHDGVLELIGTTGPMGSGGYTDVYMWQVGEDGKAMKIVKEYDANDILDSLEIAYYDRKSDLWYYSTYNYYSGGAYAKGCVNGLMYLQGGKLQTDPICGGYDDFDHKSKVYKDVYYEWDGEEKREIDIKEAEYQAEEIIDRRCAGLEKYKIEFLWVNCYEKLGDAKDSQNSKATMTNLLTESYAAFQREEKL